MAEQYQFVVRKGPKVGQVFRLLQDVVSIGRDPLSDIVINDPEISRQHARLVRIERGYAIEDFGSTNGTHIDGEKLEPGSETELMPGQLVSMGSGVILLYGMLDDSPVEHDAPENSEEQIDTPAIVASTEPPSLPTMPESRPAVSTHAAPANAPLVPSSDKPIGRSNRTWVALLFIGLVILCALAALSAYFFWGDPLMRALGVY